jgi:hypothetical protein
LTRAEQILDGADSVVVVDWPSRDAHRPLGELPGIVALAQQLGAKTVWCQSGVAGNGANDPKGCWVPEDKSQGARKIVESAGLAYIDDTYIADAIGGLGEHK